MKIKTILSSLAIFYFTLSKGADLTVQEFGANGNYSSINAAMTAANNGDRIIVISKAGNAPWIENLTVTKSLTFISDAENGKFKIDGNIKIAPSSALNITFIGLDLQGPISSSQDGMGNARTIVNIFNSIISSGVNFDHDNYYPVIAASSCYNIRVRAGKILGNTCSQEIWVFNETSTAIAPSSDSILIIGNRCDMIKGDSDKYTYVISNNFITYRYYLYGIHLTGLKSGNHYILNNTIRDANSNQSTDGIKLHIVPNSASVLILNNLLEGSGSSTGYQEAFYGTQISGVVQVGFNYTNNGFNTYFNGLINNGTNVTGASFAINPTTGAVQTGNLNDTGHPDATFTDLDLTRNDVGCYGGSFSMDNFFPTNDNNARVYYLELPRRTGTGITTVPVKAEAFDK